MMNQQLNYHHHHHHFIYEITTLHSYLRLDHPRMRAFSYARSLKRVYFRSRDKDGGHTIRSAVTENPMLRANFMALCFIEPEVLLMEVLHYGNRDLRPFLLL